MGDRQALSQEEFEALLAWLDADRERGAARYAEIHEALVEILSKRGFANAEDLADKTIDRVATQVPGVAPEYSGDPALYFYGVAKKIALEQTSRGPRLVELPNDYPAANEEEQGEDSTEMLECLAQCMQELSWPERDVILRYYPTTRRATIGARKDLANQAGISMNALRLRALRIRERLERCVANCMDQEDGTRASQ